MFVCVKPADMRLSFDRLAQMAEQIVCQNPFSGHLFLFRNKNGDKLKILYWDRDGYAIWYKRLEQGTFHFPAFHCDDTEIEAADLAALLGGIDLSCVKRRKRYRRPQP